MGAIGQWGQQMVSSSTDALTLPQSTTFGQSPGGLSPGNSPLLPSWVASYLESIAKGYNPPDGITHFGSIPFRNDTKCGYWAITDTCENGHRFAKALGCGREWCPDCREDFEKRRFARWLPKAQQIGVMGYLVITTPRGNRPRSKDELRAVRRSIVRGLKRLGFERGLSRWHWFGDKSNEWYPHLNILLDCGYLPKDRLGQVKRMVARAFKTDMVVVNYRYSQKISQKVHWLKYIVRATFLDRSWDDPMADMLYRFNNSHCWGAWKGEAVWKLSDRQREMDAIAALEGGTCPYCGAPVTWHGGKDNLAEVAFLPYLGFVEIGAGYWAAGLPP